MAATGCAGLIAPIKGSQCILVVIPIMVGQLLGKQALGPLALRQESCHYSVANKFL
jgi:hypothetical protein